MYYNNYNYTQVHPIYSDMPPQMVAHHMPSHIPPHVNFNMNGTMTMSLVVMFFFFIISCIFSLLYLFTNSICLLCVVYSPPFTFIIIPKVQTNCFENALNFCMCVHKCTIVFFKFHCFYAATKTKQ